MPDDAADDAALVLREVEAAIETLMRKLTPKEQALLADVLDAAIEAWVRLPSAEFSRRVAEAERILAGEEP